MSSVVESGFARTEALQMEWDGLKEEMGLLEKALARRPNEKHTTRKACIEGRMSEITVEMSKVLRAAQKEIPIVTMNLMGGGGADDDCGSLNEEDLRVVKQDPRSARHVIQRTYDSTDSDEDESSLTAEELRERMRRDAVAKNPNINIKVMTVDDSATDGARGVFGGLRGALRKQVTMNGVGGSNKDAPRPMDDDDREVVDLERSRLERQLRKIKRQTVRSPDDETQLKQLTDRLAVLSNQLETGMTTSPKPTSPKASTPKTPAATVSSPAESNSSRPREAPERQQTVKSLFGGFKGLGGGGGGGGGAAAAATAQEAGKPISMAPRVRSWRGNSSSPATKKSAGGDGRAEIAVEDNSDDEYETGTKKKALLGTGVASIRMLASKVRMPKQSSPPACPSTAGSNGSSTATSPAGVKPSSTFRVRKQAADASASGEPSDPFGEVTEALSKRGEKLNNLANESDKMADGANEMLSAMRALRKRQEKKNSFFG
jgi:hypothetical protein